MLLYIPAALPKMPVIDHSMLLHKEYGQRTEDGNQCWQMKKLVYDSLDSNYIDDYSYRDIVELFKEKNPDFLSWISCLPYKDWINIKIHYQHKRQGVPVHVDLLQPSRDYNHYHHLLHNEPAGYRVIMSGQLENVTYIWDHNKDKIYCNMPNDSSTNTYIMNYTTCLHGVEADPKRAILFFQFTLDPEKHCKIINESINLYNDYAVRIDMDTRYG